MAIKIPVPAPQDSREASREGYGQATGARPGRLRQRLASAGSRIALRGIHLANRIINPKTLGVRGMVFDGHGRVFLVRHSYVPGWHLPGGGVDPGETVRDALVRELREEGNLAVTGEPILHGVFHNDLYSTRDHVVVFIVRSFEAGPARKPDWEIREASFFPIDALPEGTTAATRRRLDEVAGAPLGEKW